MIDRVLPVVIHGRRGALYRRDDTLLGSIDVDPAIRPARMNGEQDMEILLWIGGDDQEAALVNRIQQCAARIDEALIALPSIKHFAVEHAPAKWLEHYSAQPGPSVIERLFLEGFEVDENDDLSVDFDFGDLDQLIVELGSDGRGRRVFLRP